MNIKEQMIEALREMYYGHDPKPVCYIDKTDNQGYHIEEIDGDWCYGCAIRKANELDIEGGGSHYHEVHVESMPENDHFSYCQDCGCLLDASLVIGYGMEDDLDCIIENMKTIKRWEDITDEMGWKLYNIIGEEESRELFPKKIAILTRKLTNLFKKAGLLEGGLL